MFGFTRKSNDKTTSTLPVFRPRTPEDLPPPMSAAPLHIKVDSATETVVDLPFRRANAGIVPPSPAVLSPAREHAQTDDMISGFWGAAPAPTTSRRSADSATSTLREPPAYLYTDSKERDSIVDELPPYAPMPEDESSESLRWMWILGFFFPLLWLGGIYLLWCPLRVESDWHAEKSDAERAQLVRRIRARELVYARRCLWSFGTLMAVVLVVAAIAVPIHAMSSS